MDAYYCLLEERKMIYAAIVSFFCHLQWRLFGDVSVFWP